MNLLRMLLKLSAVTLAVASCTVERAQPETARVTGAQTVESGTETTESAPSLGDTRIRSDDGAVMVYVPRGTFEMGSDEAEVDFALDLCLQYDTNCRRRYFSVEQPAHSVILDGFWLDKTEVTNRQYSLCVEAGVCDEPHCQVEIPLRHIDHPVVCTTWDQAVAYCDWAGGRLPTEAEWEYAARGSEGRRYPWGDAFNPALLNYCDTNCSLPKRDASFDDGFAKTAPAGNYPQGASWVGALDMAGNVWELVADRYGSYPSDEVVNPQGPPSGSRRVARGGSWHTSPDHVRSALRTHVGMSDFIDHAGFRCAQSIP
jgi:serine/threonine-protein kinase